MCLDKRHWRGYDLQKEEKPKIGYKTFYKSSSGKSYDSPMYAGNFKRATWYTDQYRYDGRDGRGFHIFTSLKGAINYAHGDCVCKVQYTHVTEVGQQANYCAIRAMRMKVVKMVKKL